MGLEDALDVYQETNLAGGEEMGIFKRKEIVRVERVYEEGSIGDLLMKIKAAGSDPWLHPWIHSQWKCSARVRKGALDANISRTAATPLEAVRGVWERMECVTKCLGDD